MGTWRIRPMLRFDLSPKEAIALQRTLASQIRLEPLTYPPYLIGGADVSMERFATRGFAGFVTLDAASMELRAHEVVEAEIPFPYIPGLLSFREIPMLLAAWEQLRIKPDVLIVDGTGLAHPRRLGIASHLGLILDIPTIGCAKSVLVGSYQEPAQERGAYEPLIHNGELVGYALRTKPKVKPVFVSPGHRITFEESRDLVASCVRAHRIPEPTRLAHETVNEVRRTS